MLSNPSTHDQEQQLSYFLCKCGADFGLYNDYHRHLMKERRLSHKKPTHKQSSNVSSLSIVSTVNVKIEHESWSSQYTTQTIFEAGLSHKEKDLKQQELLEEQSLKSDVQQAPNSSLVAKVKQKDSYIKHWSDYLLEKNEKCKEGPFYCGNCEIIYFQVEHFIIHCVQQCQTFDHPSSSHSITHKQELSKKIKISNKKNKKLKCLKKQSLPEQEPILDELQCQVFNEIFRQCLDHRNLPFYCSLCECNFIFSQSYSQHISKSHQNKVDPYSSHVILRFTQRKWQKNISLFLSPHVQWINQGEKYYCSCQPSIKIKMSQLLKHIQEAHNGVSPIYQGKFKQNPSTQERAKLVNKDEKAEYAQLKRIFNKRCDHRNIEFYCGGCSFKTQHPKSYTRHIQNNQHVSKLNRNSHIKLRLLNNHEILCIYLSPAVQWETEEQKYFCMCDKQKKMKMNDLIQHVYVQHDGISPYYPITPVSRQLASYDKYFYENTKDETIKSIIALHMITKQENFKCKICTDGFMMNYCHYSNHIMRVHNRIIDPQRHSHILIQAKYNKWQLTHYFYLPVKPSIDHGCPKYYCPCKKDQKMNVNDFVEHILQEHNGVSPSYCLDP